MSADALDIALVVEHYLPKRGGGERYVVDLATGLADRGHTVTVYAAEHDNDDPRITLTTVPAAKHPKWWRKSRFAARSRMALAGGHDVVHAVGKALGFTILNPHGGVERFWLRQHLRAYDRAWERAWATLRRYCTPRHWVLTSVERRQYASPSLQRVIAISDMVKNHVREAYGLGPERVTVVYNGVDLERFHPRVREQHRAAQRAKWGLAEDEVCCLFVGNNFRLKGVRSLVQATARLRAEGAPVRTVIVGREAPGRLAALARTLGVAEQVHFAGPEPEVEKAYAAADLYVHPTYFDACALVTFEAMACGVPVITTRWNGASGIVTPGEDGALIDDASDLRREMHGRAARLAAEKHPLEQNCERILEVYRSVLDERRKTTST
ncbi:MAG: glycosyltransferase family 4 protein [Planctomycetota bacterium]